MKIAVAVILSVIWNPDTQDWDKSAQYKKFRNIKLCELWVSRETYFGPIPGASFTWRGCGYLWEI